MSESGYSGPLRGYPREGAVLPEDYPELYETLVESLPLMSKHFPVKEFKLPGYHLVDRVVLPTPVTLRPGDTLTINYTLDYTTA